MLYIGIDLGTSAVKLLLMDEEGQIKNEISREYPLEFPQPGWSQQNPEDWKAAVLEGVPALLEGVAFAIRDSFEVARSLGLDIKRSMICGGGAKSPLWKKIMANVLNVELDTPASEQGPGMGGAMLAMVACGAYPSVQAVCDKLVKVADTVRPDPEIAARYEQRYEQFAKIYPALKGLYPQLL